MKEIVELHNQEDQSSSEDEKEPEVRKVSLALDAVTILRNFAAQYGLDSDNQRALNVVEEQTQLLGKRKAILHHRLFCKKIIFNPYSSPVQLNVQNRLF